MRAAYFCDGIAGFRWSGQRHPTLALLGVGATYGWIN